MSESDKHLEGYPYDWFFFNFKPAHTAVLSCLILKDQWKYDLLINSQQSKEKNYYLILKMSVLFWQSILHTFSLKSKCRELINVGLFLYTKAHITL